MDYLYDGSFEGVLTAIYYNYYEEKAEGIYHKDRYQFSLATNSKFLKSDPQLAAKVYTAVEQKISNEALRQIYYVYLSNHPNKENLILRYLELAFKLGAKINSYYTHPAVLPVLKTAKQVSFEAHRFFGLLRFAEARNCLYAALEPDNNIIILLADHFADRLAKENFIIHDKRRNIAVVYNRKEWFLADLPKDVKIDFTDDEAFYQQLWQSYFQHIGIDSRKNTKLQTQFVPHRYRKNLVEFNY
ncbi:MAG: DNA metabolism protein [Peptococcaceae bacterium]|mgnify:CR=1 FL=1|jgi:probable DNA metabolism protein|nr:DNA metabolism protein [Peptococcaceae bacterium]